ncbi:MAG: hypothetical protein DWB42_04110 [Chloroflexi bacterium]|nr:hypothetical protein [Chloroflexota bacterium]
MIGGVPMDILRRFFDSFIGGSAPHPLEMSGAFPGFGPEPDPADQPEPVYRRVLMITHNPVLRTQGGRTVREYFRWNDPDDLAADYIDDLHWASYGYARYEIVERLVVDGYPVKADGFRYDETTYLQAWRERRFHQPDGVDYLALAREFRIVERVSDGAIDEVWLFGHPYGGYYESIMAGPGAFWCNAPPLAGTEQAARRFVIMGFNFERGVGEMLEDLGHRAESILGRVFAGVPKNANLWERFTRHERTHPGRAECGNVHFAPNSDRDYDWGNPRPVKSGCDDWYAYPKLTGDRRRWVDCREWGSGDIRLHHLWWLRHLPHAAGTMDGIAHNWWQYIIDPNTIG